MIIREFREEDAKEVSNLARKVVKEDLSKHYSKKVINCWGENFSLKRTQFTLGDADY